jgi:hypothetical protein
LDIHQYGKGKNKTWMGFVGTKVNGLWAFDCQYMGDTKAMFIKQAYEMYKRALNGDMSDIDYNLLQRGDSGLPTQYGNIYFTKNSNIVKLLCN